MKYLLVILSILICFLVVVNNFSVINLENHKQAIEESLSKKLGYDILIENEIKMKFFPSFNMELISLKVLKNDSVILHCKNALVNLSIANVYDIIFNNIFTSSFDDIAISDTIIINDSNNNINYKNFIEHLSFVKNLNFNIKMDSLVIVLNNKYSKSNYLKFQNISLKFNDAFQSNGILKYDTMEYKYDIYIKNNDIKLLIDNEILSLDLNINKFDQNKFTLENGKIIFSLKKIDALLSIVDENYQYVKNDNDNSHYLKISTELVCQDGVISTKNLKFNSNILYQPKLEFRLYELTDDILESYLLMEASNVNLSHMHDEQFDQITINSLLRRFLKTAELLEYVNLNFFLNIDDITLANDSIKDIKISTYSVNNIIIVDQIDFKLPGESQIKFSGRISGNNIRKKLDGHLYCDSQDYLELTDWYTDTPHEDIVHHEKQYMSFEANVNAVRNMFKASQINLKIGEKTINGMSMLYEVPYDLPVKIMFVNGYNINFDELGITKSIDKYIKTLYDSDKNVEDYLNTTGANIRFFDTELYLYFDMHNSIMRQMNLDRLNGLIQLSYNYFEAQKINIISQPLTGEMNLKFVLPVLRPQIFVNLDFTNINTKLVKHLLINDTIFGISNDINFFSAMNYDGECNFKLHNIVYDDNKYLNDMNGTMYLKFGNMSIHDVNAKLWNGEFKGNASIGLSSNGQNFRFNFGLYNVLPEKMLYDILGLNKLSGYMSLAGFLNGKLEKYKSFNGNVQFEGAAMTWNGFDLLKMIDVFEGNYTYSSKLNNLNYYSKYGSTPFDLIKGSLNIENGIVSTSNAIINNKRLAGLFSMNYDMHLRTFKSAAAFAFIPQNSNEKLIINAKSSGSISNNNSIIDYSELSDFLKAKNS